jgi:hypothetical protein
LGGVEIGQRDDLDRVAERALTGRDLLAEEDRIGDREAKVELVVRVAVDPDGEKIGHALLRRLREADLELGVVAFDVVAIEGIRDEAIVGWL